jgi:hypothetical protein
MTATAHLWVKMKVLAGGSAARGSACLRVGVDPQIFADREDEGFRGSEKRATYCKFYQSDSLTRVSKHIFSDTGLDPVITNGRDT